MDQNQQRIGFVDPATLEPLRQDGEQLVRADSGEVIAPIVDGIPRFVSREENYAESFGYQWKTWADSRSDDRNPGYEHTRTIIERTHFDEYPVEGCTILECGMGGGDDTEALLTLPFAQVHSFDLSTAVERAAKYLDDSRLVISQASIFDIPYADESFDIVYCHRVLQHTPDPPRALRSICKKVRPGGLLFAHAYKRSKKYMAEWRYKYRWLSKRAGLKLNYAYVTKLGPLMHRIVNLAARHRYTNAIAYRFVPFYLVKPQHFPNLTEQQRLDMAQHVTFDALTPAHDHPMSTEEFCGIIKDEGFTIEHLFDPAVSPIYCTARKAGGEL